MSDQTLENQEPAPEQLSEILLVLDKEKKRIQAVKSINENGNLNTVDPRKKNIGEFMTVNNQGNIFSNFFSNFMQQLKNPTNFTFFKVLKNDAVTKAIELQKHIDHPTPEGEKLMNELQVQSEPSNNQEKEQNMEKEQTTSPANEYRYQADQLDWETMNNLGLSKDKLEKMNLLDPLLRGYKTNELVPVSLNLGTAVTRMDARLSLQQNKEGQVVIAIHGIRKEPNLNFEFFGHKFTDEDKKNLLQTGNMGRLVNLQFKKDGDTIPSVISVDRLTNEIVALRADKIKIPDEIKGVKLNSEQKQRLYEGKPLYLQGMLSKKGESFNATVQINADKRHVEFMFDRNIEKNQTQSIQGNQRPTQNHEASKIFRGRELNDEQYSKYKEGQTVYIDGLIDKKGQPYQGYITFNKETGKTQFLFPSQMRTQAQPAEAHKTQTAVNSEGKTNEATKKIKEPLKSGQQTPKSKKQKDLQSTTKTTKKSKSPKI